MPFVLRYSTLKEKNGYLFPSFYSRTMAKEKSYLISLKEGVQVGCDSGDVSIFLHIVIYLPLVFKYV